LPQFQLRLAKANIVWGRLNEAERALAAGIESFDARRAALTDELGLSANDESWQLFETALSLAIRKGDYERAFAMGERARATSVLEQQRVMGMPALADAERVARRDEAIVILNQFDDELAVWIVRNQGTKVVTRPIRKIDAQRLVARQQEEIRLAAARPVAGADLFDAIVRPLAGDLRDVQRIVFVPDTTYQNVSFAALWDRSRERFLVETMTLSAAPSVTGLVASASGGAVAGRAGRALIIGADAEQVADVAGAYQATDVVTGASATSARFLASAPESAVVHLAVPTRPNTVYPLLSSVIFSDEPGRRHSGTVLGRDIASSRLTSTRVVVIDQVRATPGYQTAGTFSLARAFLAAGVPAVLGTLPGANESETRELMVGFHRETAGQASAVDALTRVQRNVLRNGRRLGAWSALVIYGSDR
jgi:CHAT domain-containing protein